MIQSPISKKEAVLEKEVSSSSIVERYQKEFGIDVKSFFKDIPTVGLFRCPDTGYRFFFPFTTAGDDAFYQELQKFPWYYMDEKWEHKIALEYVKSSEKVLEIGCARGGFLKQLRKKNVTADGLEMNSDALNESKKIGLSVYSDSIETFSQKKISSYDMVCSFQVLEHVADVKSFLDASLASLKRGGRMIISVPNNDSIIMDTDDGGLLNGPPHHMGRWNMNSLIALQNHFNIRVESIHLEPLQKYHLAYALRMANTNVAKKLLKKVGFLSPLFTKASHLITYAGISAVSKYIVGHSIVIVFKKQ